MSPSPSPASSPASSPSLASASLLRRLSRHIDRHQDEFVQVGAAGTGRLAVTRGACAWPLTST